MAQDQLTQTGLGSTDWNGNRAPAGGTHTGTATIVMADGLRFVVAHSPAEALTKLGAQSAPVTPNWIAFDQPGGSLPVILDGSLVATVAPGPPPAVVNTGVLVPVSTLFPDPALLPR